MGFIIARIIAIIFLLLALENQPYGYYILLRFIVCGVSAYGAFFASRLGETGWIWILGIIAVLFNPIIPIHLDRETWAIVDLGVAVILIVSLFLLKKEKNN